MPRNSSRRSSMKSDSSSLSLSLKELLYFLVLLRLESHGWPSVCALEFLQEDSSSNSVVTGVVCSISLSRTTLVVSSLASRWQWEGKSFQLALISIAHGIASQSD